MLWKIKLAFSYLARLVFVGEEKSLPLDWASAGLEALIANHIATNTQTYMTVKIITLELIF